MVDRKALAVGIAVVVILLILFYFSPYSEVDTVTCYTPQNVPVPGGTELGPTCGIVIDPSPLFPFRSPSSEFIDFCTRNIATIEDSCNVTMETALAEETSNASSAFACLYTFNNYSSQIDLDKFSEPFTPYDTEMINAEHLDVVYLKDFAVSISSYEFDYGNCTDLKARLR